MFLQTCDDISFTKEPDGGFEGGWLEPDRQVNNMVMWVSAGASSHTGG